jgi:hypothetical protein
MAGAAAPWAGKRFAYAGWVPNVHSHLSFSLIGKWRGPNVSAHTSRFKDRLCAFVCAIERRETDDFLRPMWLTRLLHPQVTQHFVLVGQTCVVQTPIGIIDVTVETPNRVSSPGRRSARPDWAQRIASSARGAQRRVTVETASDEQGMLRGKILVLPRQKHCKDRRRQADWISKLRRQLNELNDLQDAALDLFAEELSANANANSFGTVELQFALFRTGETRIWYDEAQGERLNDKERREIARQSYYFLKDMVHHHVHHDAKSDQITPLTETGCLSPDEGEEHWRRETVWSLSRATDGLARRGTLQELREATGIIAYADAFQSTLMRYRRQAERSTEFEPNPVTYRYDFAHIRESLKVQVEQVTARRTLRSQILLAGLAGSIAMTSLLISGVSAHNGMLKPKLEGLPIELGIDPELLRSWAYLLVGPTVLIASALSILSWLWLSEDRIGVARTPTRKFGQLLRGTINSLALYFGWGSATVHRLIRGFYLGMAALCGVAIWYAPSILSLVGVRPVSPKITSSVEAPPKQPTPAQVARPRIPAPKAEPRPTASQKGERSGPVKLPKHNTERQSPPEPSRNRKQEQAAEVQPQNIVTN